ncbi:hypothetical protein Q1695_010016 [Nippostrongylus brasiliensis]|nr:hypothetical protein Q1695_010016 [Nippostrongylus brasiliensis]
MYSMDERRPAASPEDGDSSAFLGGLRRGFLAKRFESEARVGNGEDRASTKCSTDNPPFSSSGLEPIGIACSNCGVCREVVYINIRPYSYTAICFEDCSMDLHSECLTKLLRRRNIGSIDELKIATALKFKIDLRCFNPQCPAPLLVIAEHYLNCVDDCVHSAPVYSLFDFATAAGELSSDKAEPKKRFDEKNESRRAREAVETSSKKTSEVSTTSKTASDPRDNLNGYGKEKKPYPTHPPESPTPNRAVQVKKRKLTMYTMEKLLEQLESSVENPSGAVLGGKKQDHLEAPEGAVQVKESEPTMYTVVNFPELPKALPVESPSGENRANLQSQGCQAGTASRAEQLSTSSQTDVLAPSADDRKAEGGPDELFGVLKQPEQKCDRFDITGMMLASKLRTLHDINRSRCEMWMVRLDEVMSAIGRAIYEETPLN